MKQDTGKDTNPDPLPLCDGLTGWEYFVESNERGYELFDVYGIPRPGSPGKVPGLMGGFMPVSKEDSWRKLAMALARDYVPSCKPVRPKGPLAEIAIAKAAERGRPKPLTRRGPEPRYTAGVLLTMVAKQIAATGQSQEEALNDLFGPDATLHDQGSYKRFFEIKREHPDMWDAVLASHMTRKGRE